MKMLQPAICKTNANKTSATACLHSTRPCLGGRGEEGPAVAWCGLSFKYTSNFAILLRAKQMDAKGFYAEAARKNFKTMMRLELNKYLVILFLTEII